MATQEERLKQWRSAAHEETKPATNRVKRKRESRSGALKAKKNAYEGRLVDAAEKGLLQHDAWLKEGTGYVEADEGEATFKFRQEDIVKHVPLGGAQKAFNLSLPELGPYCLDYAPNGRHLLIGGRKGHLAEFDWQTGKLLCETQVYETVRDVKFLHNYLYWAAAQKKYVYIYDHSGMELHRLKSLHEPYCLEFLPHHFLLCSTGNMGVLSWQDTTSGQLVAAHPTKKGCCRVMKQNPWNAVLCLGHSFGSVSMWTPNMKTAAAQLKCHKTAISALAVDPTGRYMATASMERLIKIWDIRKFEELHIYFASKTPEALSISQTGLLAVGYGTRAEVWKNALAQKQEKPYLVHTCTGNRIHDLEFCPYEDVLGIGHAGGLSHMLVPGAGEADFDSFVANPFQTKKGRRESEIAFMLDKLPPDLITLDPEDLRKTRSARQTETVQAESEEESEEETVIEKPPEKKKKAHKPRKEAPADVPFTLRRFYK